MNDHIFSANLEEHLELFSRLNSLRQDVSIIGSLLTESLRKEGKLMLCGNGGSAADCQHIAAELTGRFVSDRKPLAAVSLTTDTSALTCIANDYSYREVFSRQVLALGRRGDCLIAISTSGKSENLILAVEEAKKIGIITIGILGRDGGSLLGVCDKSVVVPGNSTARIQEAHILIGHTLCGIIEHNLF